MKKLKNLTKLTNLNSENVNEKELSHVIGGVCCCGCFYEACGGSARAANDSANDEKDLYSPLPPEGIDAGIVT